MRDRDRMNHQGERPEKGPVKEESNSERESKKGEWNVVEDRKGQCPYDDPKEELT